MLNPARLTRFHPEFRVFSKSLKILTRGCMEFEDCTELIQEILKESAIQDGILQIQSKHTTAAVLVNENEPLVLQDMKRILERIAPQGEEYLHNDFTIRTVNMNDHEDRNGHSHCKAIFLPVSQTINIVEGTMDLGTWQRIFLLELDQSKERTLSIVLLGI